MQYPTAKMIYPHPDIAAMIAGKLSKSKGGKYEVHKVTTGYQVVLVTQCPPHMPPAKALPFESKTPGRTWAGVEFVVVDLKFRGESKVYVDAWTAEGKQISFGKSTLIGWEIKDDRVFLKMTKAIAKKRGLLYSHTGP